MPYTLWTVKPIHADDDDDETYTYKTNLCVSHCQIADAAESKLSYFCFINITDRQIFLLSRGRGKARAKVSYQIL